MSPPCLAVLRIRRFPSYFLPSLVVLLDGYCPVGSPQVSVADRRASKHRSVCCCLRFSIPSVHAACGVTHGSLSRLSWVACRFIPVWFVAPYGCTRVIRTTRVTHSSLFYLPLYYIKHAINDHWHTYKCLFIHRLFTHSSHSQTCVCACDVLRNELIHVWVFVQLTKLNKNRNFVSLL